MKLAKRHLTYTLTLLSAAMVSAVPFQESSDAPVTVVHADSSTTSYIVQGESAASVSALIADVGGDVTHELSIINAVGAQLTSTQVLALDSLAGVKVLSNTQVEVAGTPQPDTFYPAVISADRLHNQGNNDSTVLSLDDYRWQPHCLDLYQTPIAA